MKHKIYDLALIGERIKNERKKLHFSQDELIAVLHEKNNYISISRSSLYKIETGIPCNTLSLDLMLALCNLFGCELGYLLCEEGYENKTRITTDITKETGLSPTAVNTLRAWNAPATNVKSDGKEEDIKLKTQEQVLEVLSALITDRRFCTAVSNYAYHDDNINLIYTKSDTETHFTHEPTFIAIDNMQVDSILVEQALLNSITDSLKAVRNNIQQQKSPCHN